MKIPEAALQRHVAVLGKNGSGKTFAVKGIVEHLLEQQRRVCVIDPTGAWWGLRSSRDGKGPGFPILVLGGDHGDLPLPALGGAAVARLTAEQGVNLVADTSQLTVGERTRWFIDFASTLYRANRTPLHLVLDEAHNFAPQGKILTPDAGKMLHAANTLASQGRSRGLRVWMITQRPQKLHKDTLTTADMLIAMRVLHPLDRGAVEEWINGCGDPAQGKEVLRSLASLETGEGWVWYPEGSFLHRMKFPAIKTFDSSATPTDGGTVAAPKAAAEIDLTEIKAAMADAVREAEANDPKLLRARIAQLEREAKKPALAEQITVTAPDPEAEARGYARGWQEAVGKVALIVKGIRGSLEDVNCALDDIDNAALARPAGVPARPAPRAPAAPARPQPAPRAPVQRGPGEPLAKAERLILTALAQYPDGRSKTQVAILTGYAHSGGGFNNSLSALRSMGRIDGSGDRLRITDAGLAALGSYDPLPSGDALLQHWYAQLGKAERAALEALVAAYPAALSKEETAALAGYEPSGGGFNNALSRLRSLELIEGRGNLRASDALFD